ncbi:hypothetical protein DOY81_012371 [Sarcophaga bullata]|nr:hypothetical protein DOY81_012371 [Sarcophaga bullata]
MSKSDEICSASYNIPFTNNKNEVFGTSCANLYNFIYINSNHVMISTNCKPMMLKMHLEFDGSPLMDEAEERSMEVDISNNDETQFVQQLEIKLKALQDALQQANYEANKLIDCIEKIQMTDLALWITSDGGNNTTQDSNANNKQTYNETT